MMLLSKLEGEAELLKIVCHRAQAEKITILDFRLTSRGLNKELEITITGSDHCISIDDCKEFHLRLNKDIECHPKYGENFLAGTDIQIASAGLFRKMKYVFELDLFSGKKVELKPKGGVKKKYILGPRQDATLRLTTLSDQEITLAVADIEWVRLAPDLNF